MLDEWVTSDGTDDFSLLHPNLAYSVNGTANSSGSSFIDNFKSTVNGITPNDGVFYFNANYPNVYPGDTVTLAAGTYVLPATSDFNPQATQTFTGNIFVAGYAYERLSPSVAAVPEPSAWATLVAAGADCWVSSLGATAARPHTRRNRGFPGPCRGG